MEKIVIVKVSNKLYKTGKYTWIHNRPTDYRNGIAYHKLLGPCPQCGGPTFDYGGGWRCNGDLCCMSAGNPVGNLGPEPDWWETNIDIFLDGNMWCATFDNFINLQESVAGFGETPRKAVKELLKDSIK